MDDNFFIDETQKLKNSFYNGDKSLQLFAINNLTNLKRPRHTNELKNMSTDKAEFQQPLMKRLRSSKNNNLNPPINGTINNISNTNTNNNNNSNSNNNNNQILMSHNNYQQMHTVIGPNSSLLDRLRSLCENKSLVDAVETLIEATEKGCCFMEKYLAILLNYCSQDSPDHNDKLLGKLMDINFDRNQLTENLRRPEFKTSSVDHIINILRRVQEMLDYRETKAVDWLWVLIDAYFVELATSEEAVDIIDQIITRIDHKCAWQQEANTTSTLLKSVLEKIDKNMEAKPTSCRVEVTPFYRIEKLSF